MRRRSMVALTLPGTWSSVKSGASGNSSQATSRQRSPPRIPVSQSWTRAMRGAATVAARQVLNIPDILLQPQELSVQALERGHHRPGVQLAACPRPVLGAQPPAQGFVDEQL